MLEKGSNGLGSGGGHLPGQLLLAPYHSVNLGSVEHPPPTPTPGFLLNGLPRHYHPVFKSANFARATDDRFFLVIEARDPQFVRSKTQALLETLEPLSIESLED